MSGGNSSPPFFSIVLIGAALACLWLKRMLCTKKCVGHIVKDSMSGRWHHQHQLEYQALHAARQATVRGDWNKGLCLLELQLACHAQRLEGWTYDCLPFFAFSGFLLSAVFCFLWLFALRFWLLAFGFALFAFCFLLCSFGFALFAWGFWLCPICFALFALLFWLCTFCFLLFALRLWLCSFCFGLSSSYHYICRLIYKSKTLW